MSAVAAVMYRAADWLATDGWWHPVGMGESSYRAYDPDSNPVMAWDDNAVTLSLAGMVHRFAPRQGTAFEAADASICRAVGLGRISHDGLYGRSWRLRNKYEHQPWDDSLIDRLDDPDVWAPACRWQDVLGWWESDPSRSVEEVHRALLDAAEWEALVGSLCQ